MKKKQPASDPCQGRRSTDFRSDAAVAGVGGATTGQNGRDGRRHISERLRQQKGRKIREERRDLAAAPPNQGRAADT